jgi:hypothetical protein
MTAAGLQQNNTGSTSPCCHNKQACMMLYMCAREGGSCRLLLTYAQTCLSLSFSKHLSYLC